MKEMAKELLTFDKPNFLNWIGAVLGVFMSWWMGLPPIYHALAAVQGADILTGVLCACAGKSRKTETGGVASKPLFVGLVKKALEWLMVWICWQCGTALGMEGITGAAAVYMMATELVSLMENIEIFGLHVPMLEKILDVAKERAENDNAAQDAAELGKDTK